jgi:hypothetical protein
MKNFAYFFSLVIISAISSCQKADVTTEAKDIKLTGKWMLVSRFISAGPPGEWYNVPANANNYVEFKADGNLTGNQFTEYSTYAVKDSITVTLTKSNSNVIQNYSYKIDGNFLTLSPAGPIFCIEGCATKYIRQ